MDCEASGMYLSVLKILLLKAKFFLENQQNNDVLLYNQFNGVFLENRKKFR